nr:isoprene synthase [Garcinia subelliptica]
MATQMLCLPRTFGLRRRVLNGNNQMQSVLNGSSTGLKVRCAVSTETTNLSAERRSANFQPTIWSYDKLQSLESNIAIDTNKDKAKLLEAEVRSLIDNEKTDVVSMLELIDSVQRLGLGYRFKNEIRKALDRFVALGGLDNEATKTLHVTALGFRLLRQHGFEVFQDVFSQFKEQSGKFMNSLSEDVEGILSLYEACYFAIEGETLLDEAKAFTVSHLKVHKEKSGIDLADQIGHALELPLHHRIDRQEARWNIEEYRKKGDVNQVVLELAVLDFNLVQSVFQRDLRDMSRWWSGLALASKLSFSRDRLMESFFWSVGMCFEPQCNSSRKGITKVFQLVTTIDDVYDVYGTQEELVLFTDAVERWDLDAVKDLPDYMKLCFLALYNTVNEMAYEILKETGENAIPYLIKAWTDLCKAFFQEAKWVYNKATPSFEEYLENAWRSVSGAVMLIHAYFMLGQMVSKDELEHLENYHELLRWPSVIFRLCNDLATSSAELARGETVNAISCYMNQAGVSEEEAREHINKVINDTWKKINKYQVVKTPFSEPFIETAINLARISHVQYQHGDGHGAPDTKSKDRIQTLIIEPISI